ncbi:hypothetical protein NPIL_47431 [Nephila pilipes]|uniref:Uncharacterized protein n=1 Tax=Nephila pilipes TaxID=299642 RepID=A0A8X6N0B1_NEPPI|nr:hypothetical protein NPIL_47431 [Nephila pilipes]
MYVQGKLGGGELTKLKGWRDYLRPISILRNVLGGAVDSLDDFYWTPFHLGTEDLTIEQFLTHYKRLARWMFARILKAINTGHTDIEFSRAVVPQWGNLIRA